jgi:UDP-N-acetylglucosamine 2-epimerase (non-hydrolysing)
MRWPNLQAEGFADEQIHLVGNVMVDTLLANADRAAARGTLAGLGLRPQQYGLVTLHRPANVDDPAVLGALLPALAEISRSCPLVVPAHPRVAGRAWRRAPGCSADHPAGRVSRLHRAGGVGAAGPDRFRRGAGGTTVLGVACLTLRDSTERPITVTEGALVGRDPDRIVKTALKILAAPLPRPRKPALWDGQAGQRIAAALVDGHHARSH